MRVRSVFDDIIFNGDACTTLDFGETEDYFIKIFNRIPIDLELFKVNVPQQICDFPDTTTISVEIRNLGTNEQSNFPVFFQVDEQTPVEAIFTETIFPGQRVTFNFPTKADFSAVGKHNLDVWTDQDNDGHNFNDSLLNTIIDNVEFRVTDYPFMENFEGDFPPEGWKVINPDELVTWELQLTNSKTNRSPFLDIAGSRNGELDDLNTLPFDFRGLKIPKLRFKVAYAQSGTEKDNELRVIISKDCGASFLDTVYRKNGEDLATVTPRGIRWVPLNNSEWREESVDLSQFKEQSNILLKFQNLSDRSSGIYIDDVEIVDAPSNDFCEDAREYFLDSNSIFKGNAEFATQSLEPNPCDGRESFIARDLWFKFVSDTSDVFIGALGSADYNAVIEVYRDSCGGSLLDCSDTANSGEIELMTLENLQPGKTFFVRVYHFGEEPSTDPNFNFVIQRIGLAPNGECVDAQSLRVNPTCIPINGLAFGAESFPTGCSGNADGDVWYSFVATQPNLFIKVDGFFDFDAVIELWEDCDGQISVCEDNQFIGETEILEATNLTVGDTYFLRVYDFTEPSPTTAIFSICVSENEPTGFTKNNFSETLLKVYPNPTNSVIHLDFQSNTDRNISISLIKINGQVIWDKIIEGEIGDFMETLELPINKNGVFYLQINSEHLNIFKKIVLIR